MPKKQLTFVNLSMEELAIAIQEEDFGFSGPGWVQPGAVGAEVCCDLFLVEVYQLAGA